MNLKATVLFALLGSIWSQTASAAVDRVDPPNWWVGMADPSLQLMMYGKDIGSAIMNSPNDYPVISGLQPRRKAMEVVNQLRVLRSNHKLYDDYARRTLSFIQAHTP